MSLPKGGTTLTASQFKFAKAGDFLIGKLARQGTIEIDKKPANTYAFDCGEAGFQRCLGTAQLDEALIGVQVGTIVGIEYLGEKKTASKRTVKAFDVQTYDSEDSVTLGCKSSA